MGPNAAAVRSAARLGWVFTQAHLITTDLGQTLEKLESVDDTSHRLNHVFRFLLHFARDRNNVAQNTASPAKHRYLRDSVQKRAGLTIG